MNDDQEVATELTVASIEWLQIEGAKLDNSTIEELGAKVSQLYEIILNRVKQAHRLN